MNEPGDPYVIRYATCITPGCSNAGLPIKVRSSSASVDIVCGVCGEWITDIADIKPEEGTVLPEWILDQLAIQNSDN